jgi:hypothetical protein
MTTELTKKMTVEKVAKEASAETHSEKAKPAQTFRNGAIAASVWPRQTATGFAYFDFSLSRSWKSSTSDKEGYSTNFFPQNAEALVEVIQQASRWIADKMTSTTDSAKPPAIETRRAA